MLKYTIFNTPLLKSAFRLSSRLILKVLGWKTVGTPPGDPKYVLIVAPHTSNWDFLFGLLLAFSLGLEIYWMGKHVLFRFPLRFIMMWLGGIPIDRTRANRTVDQTIQKYNENKKLVIGTAPEGTRSRVSSWKTGFYHIAVNAGVPIMLSFIDYKTKSGGLGPLFHPTGNLESDMKIILGFYSGIMGMHPENYCSSLPSSG
jgi:1-acyl-sn-glycerol-3-phosphate acyltransferase